MFGALFADFVNKTAVIPNAGCLKGLRKGDVPVPLWIPVSFAVPFAQRVLHGYFVFGKADVRGHDFECGTGRGLFVAQCLIVYFRLSGIGIIENGGTVKACKIRGKVNLFGFCPAAGKQCEENQ